MASDFVNKLELINRAKLRNYNNEALEKRPRVPKLKIPNRKFVELRNSPSPQNFNDSSRF